MKKTTRGALLAALLALTASSCDRDRSNPLDPQSDFVRNRPATPAQLVVQPGVGVIRLAWQGVEDRDLAGYAIFRAAQSNGTYEFVSGDGDSALGITTGKTTFADSIRGTTRTFFYRLAAVDTSGLQSELSQFVGATATEDNVAPQAPQNLSAVPDEDALGTVVLRWSAPQTDSDGRELSGLSEYIVLRAEAGTGGVVPVDTLLASIRQFTDSGLKTLTTYNYSLVARDPSGNTSQPASAVSVTTPGLPTPQNVSAADGIGRITVTWQGVDDEALVGYDVFRSTTSDGGYTRLAGTEGGTFTTGRTSYIDSSLSGGSLRFYRVRAVGTADALSEMSRFVSGEAKADEVPPASPDNLSVVPDADNFGLVTVSWNIPQRDANGGELTGLTGYRVFRSEETTDSFVPVATVNDPQYVDTGLEESNTYYYTVIAFDESGNESGRATAVRVRTQGEDRVGPGAPQNVSAVADEASTDRIDVRWSAPTVDSDGAELTGLTGFTVFRSEGGPGSFVPVDTVAADVRVWQDSGLKGLTLYAYTVVAFDAAGNESRPATSSQTRTGGIATPQGLTASDEIGRISIRWQPVDDSDLAGYDVYRSTRSDGGFQRLAGSEGGSFTTGRTSYVDSNLAGGTLFFYKVEAVGTNNLRSEPSAFIGGEALRDESAPGAPRNVSAVANENDPSQITVGWSAPSVDADGTDLTGLDGFYLLRAEGADGALIPVDTLAADLRTFTDTGLKALTTYRYAMVAFDASGNQSVQTSSSTTRTAGIPAPQGLSASDEIGRIVVSWRPVDDTDLAGYDVYRSSQSDTGYERLAGSQGGSFTTGRTSYIDSNLVGGTLFFYKVQAIGTNGLRSERSAFIGGEALADESAPGSPRNVSAVADENDPGQITIGWSAPSADADGGKLTGLGGYFLLRSEGADGALLPVDTLAADLRTYVDTGLKALTTYRYAVVAFDASGNQSAQALSSSSRTAGVPTPTSVVVNDGLGRITVRWQPVVSDDVIGYDVYRATQSDGTYQVIAGSEGSSFTTGRTTYVDSNLAGGTLLFYRIRAIGDNGLISELSAIVSGRAAADESAPGAPQNVSVIPSETDPTQITVRWTAPILDASGAERSGLDGFRLLRATEDGSLVPIATLAADVRQYADSGLRSLTSYRYALIAFDAAGNESGQSAQALARTIGVPVPTGVRASDGIGRIQLSWNAVDDDDLIGYNVSRSTRPDLAFVSLTGDGGSAFTTGRTSFVDSTVAAGQLFYYRVSAVTSNLESEPSVFVSGQADADDVAPATPSDLVAIADDAQAVVTLSWTGSRVDQGGGELTGLDSYVLFRGKESASAMTALDTVAASSTSFTDNTLQAATTYFYAVSALDASGNISPRTAAVSATTQGIGAPLNVSASGDVKSITVSWRASDEEALLGYNVYRSARSDQGYTRLEGSEGTSFTTGKTSYVDSNLTGGQILFYRVSVITSDGESAQSSFDGATVQTDTRPPAAPTFLDGEPVTGDPERLSLTWKAPSSDSDGRTLTGVSLYRIYRSSTADGDFQEIATSTTTSYDDTELEQRTTYFYQVEALDEDGNVGPRSSTEAATTSGVDAPTNVRLVATTPSNLSDSPTVTISWTKSAGAIVRYEVERTTVANSVDDADYTAVTPNNIATSRDDTGVVRATTYYYRVRAVDVDSRESDWTDPLSIAVQN